LEQKQANLNLHGSSNESIESLIRQVNEQRNIVVYLRSTIDEGNLEFERVHKQATDVHNNLGALKEHVVYRRHDNAI
jgi:hypothetical protein